MRPQLPAIVLLLASVLRPDAFATPPGSESFQYNRRVWLKRDGLPHNTVPAITQTKDGYLWVGTLNGLARFDGQRFKTFTPRTSPGLGAPYIYSLLPLRDGGLLIGTATRGFSRMRGDTITHIAGPPGVEGAVAQQLYEDRQGRIWGATTAGLALIEGDSVVRVYGEHDGIPSLLVRSIAEDREGNIYIAAGSQILMCRDSCFRVLLPSSALQSPPARLVFSADGTLWIGTFGQGVLRYRDGVVRRFGESDGLSSDLAPVVIADRQGGVWVGTGDGSLHRIRGDRVRTITPPGVDGAHETLTLFQDREGNIWRGTVNGGLNRLARSACVTYRLGAPGGQGGSTVLFENTEGSLVATDGISETFLFQGFGFRPARILPAGVKTLIQSSWVDSRGVFWLATTGGMYRLVADRWDRFDIGLTTAVAEDAHGRIWAGTETGLCLLRGKSVHVCRGTDSVCSGQVRFLLADRKDNLWVGTQTAGLACMVLPDTLPPGSRFCENGVAWYRKESGLPSNWVTSVLEDDSSGVWVGTMGGLAYVENGRVFAFGAGSGLPEEAVFMVLPDDRGNIWFSTANGIVRAAKRDLRRAAGGRASVVAASVFGIHDGMSTDECTGGSASSGIRTRDGRLWFPTTDGVVLIDPAVLPANPVSPSVVIEQVIVDGRNVPMVDPVVIPPGRGELEIRYVGISLAGPERVRYRAWLEGHDDSWIDAGPRRAAYYTNLPPGEYRFRVIAANGDGIWNEAGAAVALTLEPHFNQTIWFYLLAGLAVMMVGAGAHALYRRGRERQLAAAQLESKLARAQLRILEMQMQPHFLFNALNGIMVLISQDPARAARMISRLSEFLRAGLQRVETKEVPLRQELDFVDRYLEIELLRFGDRLTIARQVDEGVLDALIPPMVLQPLVENAIRHGVARRRGRVTLEIIARQTNGLLDIRVCDDGAGLNGSGDGGIRERIGLGNTRARLEQLYGSSHLLSVLPRAGGGVEVTLQVPFRLQTVEP